MVKVILIVIGSLAALYAAVAIVQLVHTLLATNAENPYEISRLAASVVPVCLGLIVSLICFLKAFGKPPT
jgi:hypothetical protein